MRRSELLKVQVHCPHFQRPVSASKNVVTDRLVHCDSATECCSEAEPAAPNEPAKPYPRGCPVYPSLARG